jgi:hypothetical protein
MDVEVKMARPFGTLMKPLPVGFRCNRLVIAGDATRHPADRNRVLYPCRCDCGVDVLVRADSLRSGQVKSCGCYTRAMVSKAGTRHGMSRTRLYNTWRNMKGRCAQPHAAHQWHHGRGITVCAEWQTFEPFRDWALANGYRDDLEIDRIDNDGHYCPQNCRWVDESAQLLNRRPDPAYTAFGECKSLAQWAKDPRCRVGHAGLWKRLQAGVPMEQALTTPRQTYKKRG